MFNEGSKRQESLIFCNRLVSTRTFGDLTRDGTDHTRVAVLCLNQETTRLGVQRNNGIILTEY